MGRPGLVNLGRLYLAKIGWMGAVAGGEVAGTTGRGSPSRRCASSCPTPRPASPSAPTPYPSRPTSPTSAGRPPSATAAPPARPGQSRAVEALRVRLSGELSARYTVWYRVHSAEFGWLGWACDGARRPARRATAAPSRPSRSRSCPRATPPRATPPVLLRAVAMNLPQSLFAHIRRILVGCRP